MAHNDIVQEQELGRLSAEVKKAGGKLILMISPDSDLGPRFTKVYNNAISQSKTPVLILEAHRHVDAMKAELAGKGLHSPTVIATGTNNPFLHTRGEPYDFTQKDLVALIRRLGAKTVLLGGSHSNAHGDPYGYWPPETPEALRTIVTHEKKLNDTANVKNPDLSAVIAEGCVGTTYRNLISQGVNVRLFTPAIWPTKPEYNRTMRERELRAAESLKERGFHTPRDSNLRKQHRG